MRHRDVAQRAAGKVAGGVQEQEIQLTRRVVLGHQIGNAVAVEIAVANNCPADSP
jgi:hypothetical protein